MALVIGNIYEGKVVNITNFGAFVDINGETGLVHISEVSNKYIKDIRDYLKDKLDVRV
ncbi:Putative ribosomal protein, partial [Candidatus Arthromitus sp. SFB-3]